MPWQWVMDEDSSACGLTDQTDAVFCRAYGEGVESKSGLERAKPRNLTTCSLKVVCAY